MFIRIEVEHPVPYVHIQNRLAEAFIKRLELIAQTLVMHAKLSISAWGYAILHLTMLVRLRPILTQPYFALQLPTGYEPNVSHLHIFGCAVYILIGLSLLIKIGSQRKMRIYIDYDSFLIICYLKPLTSDIFIAHLVNCHFDAVF